jgi:hypothetical protein
LDSFNFDGVKSPRYPLSLRSLGFRERVGREVERQIKNTSGNISNSGRNLGAAALLPHSALYFAIT